MPTFTSSYFPRFFVAFAFLFLLVVGPICEAALRILPARKINPKDGAEMILIPAGKFAMGDSDLINNPRHSVSLTGYYLYKNLVTVGMYEKFCQATGRKMPPSPKFNSAWSKKDHPIVNVTWQDAMEYCTWAGVLLPTEAQWEKAARGTDGRQYPWGNTFDQSKLRCSKDQVGDAGGTVPVESCPSGASPYGIQDMAGNVWQWCSDRDDDNRNGTGQYRFLRGGSWFDYQPVNFRVAFRYSHFAANRDDNIGFRCSSPR